MVHVHHRRVQRVLHAPLQRIVVADRRTPLQAALRTDRAGLVQQGLGKAGLTGGRWPDQGQGSNGGNAG
jgi:hypothetical protein